jgi:hypothetical protein
VTAKLCPPTHRRRRASSAGVVLDGLRKLLVMLLPALGPAIVSDDAWATACRAHQYAVYLSPGYEKGVRWGGYHVTLTGFSADHVCHGSMEAALRKAWRQAQGGKPYSFKSKTYKKDYQALAIKHPWGLRWGVSFKSGMLKKLTKLLGEDGFKQLKSH